MNLSHWRFPFRTVAYGNLLRECIQMRCSICIAQAAILVFCLSALSWVYVEEVSICLFCVTKISPEDGEGRTMTDRYHTCHVSCSWWTERELSTPQPPAGLGKLTPSLSFSLHLFPSLYGCQTMLSSEGWNWTAAVAFALRLMTLFRPPCPLSGQSRSPLRQRWNRLPALSALKCSLTSHPDCEKLI